MKLNSALFGSLRNPNLLSFEEDVKKNFELLEECPDSHIVNQNEKYE